MTKQLNNTTKFNEQMQEIFLKIYFEGIYLQNKTNHPQLLKKDILYTKSFSMNLFFFVLKNSNLHITYF